MGLLFASRRFVIFVAKNALPKKSEIIKTLILALVQRCVVQKKSELLTRIEALESTIAAPLTDADISRIIGLVDREFQAPKVESQVQKTESHVPKVESQVPKYKSSFENEAFDEDVVYASYPDCFEV
jgi:hypothetical protein